MHCGHKIGAAPKAFVGAVAKPGRVREPGASMLAIQLSRQLSCAVKAQAHGLRHSESTTLSSVSSRRQIQHLRGSLPSVVVPVGVVDVDLAVGFPDIDDVDDDGDRALLAFE